MLPDPPRFGMLRMPDRVLLTQLSQGGGTHICCVLRSSSSVKMKVNLNFSLRSTVKPPYLFEVFGKIGQSQSKILAKMSAVIGSMQCSNKKFLGQDFDRGQRSKYTAYASATPLYHVHYNVFVPPPFVNPGSAPG